MELVLAHPADRGELADAAARGDDLCAAVLSVLSNAVVEIKARGGIGCVACRRLVGSRAARRGTFALAHWEDDVWGYRLFCERCAGQQAADLLDQAAESLLVELRFELHGAGAVAAVGNA